MMTPNDLSNYYKTISNTELLNILENVRHYQPSAIEAAKKEFSDRQLSETEIIEAKEPLIAKQIQEEKKKEKLMLLEGSMNSSGNALFEAINPIQAGKPSTDKTIRQIVIIFGIIFLYRFIKDFWLNLSFVKDIPSFPMVSIFYLLSQVLLPIAIVTFWKRKIIGWTLLTIYLTFSAVGATLILFQSFNRQPSDFALLNGLFPRPTSTSYIIQLFYLVGTQCILCKANIREVFSVDKQKMSGIIFITSLVSFFYWFTNLN